MHAATYLSHLIYLVEVRLGADYVRGCYIIVEVRLCKGVLCNSGCEGLRVLYKG